MRATVATCTFGVLAFNEKNEVIEKVLFQKNPQYAAKAIVKIESGKIVDELAKLIELLKKRGYEIFVFDNESIASEAKGKLGVSVEVSKAPKAYELLRLNAERFAVETGFIKEAEGLSLWTHNVTLEIAKLKVKRAVEKRDLIVVKTIQTLDDLDKTLNLFMGRIREWYSVHFPELDRLVDKHETYARLVMELGNRENFTVERLEEGGIPKSKAKQIAKTAETSMGADLDEGDISQIQALCRSVIGLYQLRQTLEDYLNETMDEVAPSIKAITGSLLGARLIALAGGLTNLAKMPASTLQVLGAEKALFRSLRTGAKPPKHGVIFQHAFLQEAKKWQRGKIARALAGKLAIAARADAFGGRYVGDELKADLEKRVEEVREKYSEPPKVIEREPKLKKKRRGTRVAGKG